MSKLLLYHFNSSKSKKIVELIRANLQQLRRDHMIDIDDINDVIPGAVTNEVKSIKLVQADYIIVLVDIDLINDNEFYDYWQEYIIKLGNPFLVIAIQSFYGFKDLPIYVNQWPNIYGTELLGTTSDYNSLIDIIKKELT
jgi:hypothetical protein